ncbi:hypothetical protein ALC62_13493 [Cyphomyrmex costatus]|uniref:Uncharacterized protein n=1 Tax=Cyphomyrmex costatus TaxID=456900 RepID=A0A151I9V7_9HYME|nr:hypothetical protein ALC62_13493 [Cyphomyrmex costatus]
MRFVRQSRTIGVSNLDRKTRLMSRETVRDKCKHGSALPSTIRCIICGPSNCGKTNILLSLIESPHGLRFENIYVYSKSLFQPKYRYLEKLLESIDDIGYYAFSNNGDVIPPCEALPNSIFVFDDVACDKQNTIREYFAMGRHASIDCFYLCQTYAEIPNHLIRDNANFLILFKQDGTNLKHIYNDHVNNDMSYEKFCTLCHLCWQRKYGFVVIDKDSALHNGRYRRGFDDFAIL